MPEACLFFVLTILDELGQLLASLLENLERHSIARLLRLLGLLLTSHKTAFGIRASARTWLFWPMSDVRCPMPIRG